MSDLPLPVPPHVPERPGMSADTEEAAVESDGEVPGSSSTPTAGLVVDVQMLSPAAYLVHLGDRLAWLHSRYVPELADFVAGVRDSRQVHRLLHLLTCNLLRMLRLLLVHPESAAPSEHRAGKKTAVFGSPFDATVDEHTENTGASDNSSGLFSGLDDEATQSEERDTADGVFGMENTEAQVVPQLPPSSSLDVSAASADSSNDGQSSSPRGGGGGHSRRSSVMRRRRSSVALFAAAKLKRGGEAQGRVQGRSFGLKPSGALSRSKMGPVGVKEEDAAQSGSSAASSSSRVLPYTDSDVTLHSLGLGSELASESGTFVRRLSWPHLDALFVWALTTSCQTVCPPRFLRALDAQLRQLFTARPCACPPPPMEGLLFDYL